MMTRQAPFAEIEYLLPSCTLRPLAEEDARTASGVLAMMTPWLDLGYSREGLLRYLLRADPALSRYGIAVSGEAGGVVCVRFPWLRGPYLEMLAVFPAGQGRGIGGEIIRWMEDECGASSGNVWALTSSFNRAAREFYRKAGFTELAPIPNLVSAGFDEILLRKEIRRS